MRSGNIRALWRTAWGERKRLLRFLVIGGLSTGTDYLLYRLLLRCGLGSFAAKACSMSVVILFSFFANRKWSFRDVRTGRRGEAARFLACQAVNIGVNSGLNSLMIELTSRINLSFIVATGVAMTVNFLLQRYWVFGKKSKEK